MGDDKGKGKGKGKATDNGKGKGKGKAKDDGKGKREDTNNGWYECACGNWVHPDHPHFNCPVFRARQQAERQHGEAERDRLKGQSDYSIPRGAMGPMDISTREIVDKYAGDYVQDWEEYDPQRWSAPNPRPRRGEMPAEYADDCVQDWQEYNSADYTRGEMLQGTGYARGAASAHQRSGDRGGGRRGYHADDDRASPAPLPGAFEYYSPAQTLADEGRSPYQSSAESKGDKKRRKKRN